MISNNKEKDQIPLEREPSEKKESPPKLCVFLRSLILTLLRMSWGDLQSRGKMGKVWCHVCLLEESALRMNDQSNANEKSNLRRLKSTLQI